MNNKQEQRLSAIHPDLPESIEGIDVLYLPTGALYPCDTGQYGSNHHYYYVIVMKDLMEPFEKGDYVKFKDAVFDVYTKSVYYSDNLFKIIEIKSDGLLRLTDIEQDIQIKDVEAIPVDGNYDRNLYYDPVIAASYVAFGHPVPGHHSPVGEYYMDGLGRMWLNKKTLKDIVEEHNCKFVHEVQHCLNSVVHRDDLKLDKTIKTNLIK